MKKKNLSARVDNRSYEARGIDKIPTKHLGVSATAMERRRIASERGNESRETKIANIQSETLKIQRQYIQKEIAYIHEDMGWNKIHETMAQREIKLPNIANNEQSLCNLQQLLAKEYAQLKDRQPTEASKGRTVEYDLRQIPYFDYHRNKVVADISFLQDKIKGYLETLEQTKTEVTPKPAEPSRPQPQETPKPTEQPRVSFNAASVAHQLAMLQNEFVRETVRSQERTTYQPNPIHQQQAGQIEDYAKYVKGHSETINQLKAERDSLGMFKGKEKKELQGKIDYYEQLRRGNIDKLKGLGVSDPSRAEETVREKRQLAAQEQEKSQAAKLNEGAGRRAAEAKAAILDLAKTVPADQQQSVRSQMGQYADPAEQGTWAYKNANIEIQKQLDEVFKGRAESKEHEKIKTYDRER